MTATDVNRICERAVEFWEENGSLHPEVLALDSVGELQEVIDGVPDENADLIGAIKERMAYFS